MKKILKVLLLLIACTAISFGSVRAEESEEIIKVPQLGQCGENVYWGYEDGVLVIWGTGPMYDYVGPYVYAPGPNEIKEKTPWLEDAEQYPVKTAIIEDGVTSLSPELFRECSTLTSVTIPASVERLGYSSFYKCTALTSVEFQGTALTELPKSLFSGCSSLPSIMIPEGVELIDEYAFNDCTQLAYVDVPETVQRIKTSAFAYCSALTDIQLPQTMTEIGSDAFQTSGLLSIRIPEGVTKLDIGLFYYCRSLRSVSLPSTLTSIERAAFSYCNSLESITLPSAVRSIGEYAFNECTALSSLSLPNNVETLGDYCFYKNAFSSLTLPTALQTIGKNAFALMENLTSIKIPNSVTSVGSRAFYGCTALKSATLSSGMKAIPSIMFARCSALTKVTIPKGIRTIGAAAFDGCSKLKSVTLPSSLTQIGQYAFTNTGVTSLVLPKAVTAVGEPVMGPGYVELELEEDGDWDQYWNSYFDSNLLYNQAYALIFSGNPTAEVAPVCAEAAYRYYYPADNTKWKAYVKTLTENKKGYIAYTGAAADLNPKDIGWFAKVVLDDPAFAKKLADGKVIYNGKAWKPNLKLTDDKVINPLSYYRKDMVKDEDYSLSYKTTNAGTGVITIKGKGRFGGSTTYKFTIKKRKITSSNAKVTVGSQYVYNAKEKKPQVAVTYSSKKLVKGTDFDVAYTNNKSVGTAKITVTMKGNYSGTLKASFKIIPQTTELTSLSSPAKKELDVKWKLQKTQTTGYQIQYSQSKTFASGNKSIKIDDKTVHAMTINKLTSGKTYYVRIRTYKIIDGKYYYSKWSDALKAKAK